MTTVDPALHHPAVPHPRDFLTRDVGWFRRANNWACEHLAILFGATAVVWLFMVLPLVTLTMPASLQTVVFFLSSGWIQLWALPLLTYVGNRAEQARAAKADADHLALSSVHTTVDRVADINATQDTRLDRIERHLGIPPVDTVPGPRVYPVN